MRKFLPCIIKSMCMYLMFFLHEILIKVNLNKWSYSNVLIDALLDDISLFHYCWEDPPPINDVVWYLQTNFQENNVFNVFSGTKNWLHEANLFLPAINGKVFSCLIGKTFSGLPACNWVSVLCTCHFMVTMEFKKYIFYVYLVYKINMEYLTSMFWLLL